MPYKRLLVLTLSGLCAVALSCGLFASQPQTSSGRTNVWLGVYTNAQSARGKIEFEKSCIKCHAANLDGIRSAAILGNYAPRFSLRGTDFIRRWRETNVHDLYSLIKDSMPPHNQPGVTVPDLSEQKALDLTTYIMQRNDFPAGNQDLSIAELRGIQIQGKQGPEALPSFALVQVVGCFKQLKPGVWGLAQASAPTRARELTKPTSEEVAASAAEPSGTFEVALDNLGYVGTDFVPADHDSHKMQVRGVLINPPMRIDVRTLVEVAPKCAP